MKFDPRFPAVLRARTQLAGAIAGVTALSAVWGGVAYAEPSQDSLANLNELSKQSEQLAESIRAAQRDLDAKLQLVAQADSKHAADLAALDAAKAQLAAFQGTVDTFVSAVYIGGRTDDLTAIMTATSPKNLIDQLSIRRLAAQQMSERLQGLHAATVQAGKIQTASAVSMVQARVAVDAAAAVRADMQTKQSQLRARMDEVAQQAVLSAPPAEVMAALGLPAPIPTVGMGGLVPNARRLVAYIMATYPGVQSIGGVRADPLPDHPSGRAIDIMIGSDMGLGDAINADIQAQAGRFGVQYTMWRVANHYNHVHITVS